MSVQRKKDAVTGMLNFGSRLVSVCAALLATVLILYSGYVLYDSMAIEISAFSANSDLLKYKPSVMAQATENQPSLADINEDYRAWITVLGDPASPIDYPIMQGPNDLYYASHDIYKEPSLTGAIYLASGNMEDFSHSYNLLYGHHMDNGAMFGSLDRFRDQSYFDSHKKAVVITKSGVSYEVTFFALATTSAYEKEIYTVGNRMKEVKSFLQESEKNGGSNGTKVLISDWKATANMTKMIALSTCASAETDGRLVLFGIMTRIGSTPTETGHGGSATPEPASRVPVKLTVKFMEGGKEVFPQQVLTYLSGDGYYVVAPQYPGYEADIQIVRGTIWDDMTVIVTYRPLEGWNLKIRYIFRDGRTAAPAYQAKLQTGEYYDVESPVIDGYKTLTLRRTGVNQGRDEQFTVIYVPEDEELGDPPTPLGLELTFMQVGVCVE